jgi:putative ABC transport system permease protein
MVGGAPWWQSDPETGARLGGVLPSTAIPREGARTATVYLEPGWRYGHLTPFKIAPPTGGIPQIRGPLPVTPALTSSSMLRRLGLKVGDTVQLRIDDVTVGSTVVGTIDQFPTVYSRGGDFFVVALEPTMAAIGYFGHRRPWPDQLWVKAKPGQGGRVAASLRSTPDVVDVFDRAQLEQDARAAPLRVSLAANLGLGFGATLLLALLGFAIHFGLVARSRATDYAILEANGMDRAQIGRSLALEQAVLLAFSLFAGYGLGLLLSLAILPGLQVGTDLADTIPPPIVRADPVLILAALSMVAIVTLVAGRLIAGAGSRVDLVGELRALG